jgi:hypothetical protein
MLLTFSGSFMFERMITSDGLIVDGYSYYLFLYNFSVVGVAAVFWTAAPELLKDAYLVVISIIMAFLLSLFPPWTTWMLVVSLSIYDLFAVLTPCGPLKIIIAMSKKRAAEGEAFPILVYETTPAVDPSSSSSLSSSSSSSSLQCDESASLLRPSARAAAGSDSTDCNTVLGGALALQVNDSTDRSLLFRMRTRTQWMQRRWCTQSRAPLSLDLATLSSIHSSPVAPRRSGC